MPVRTPVLFVVPASQLNLQADLLQSQAQAHSLSLDSIASFFQDDAYAPTKHNSIPAVMGHTVELVLLPC